MIDRLPTHCKDETCPACVIAGDFIFLAHHSGGHDKDEIVHQMEKSFEIMGKTLTAAGATFDDMVQLNLYLKNIDDFSAARDIFPKYFKNGFPARMTTTTHFVNPTCLCMIDGIAYKKQA